MAQGPHFPFRSALGHLTQEVNLETTRVVISHTVDTIEELSLCIYEARRNSELGRCTTLALEGVGIAMHKLLRNFIYLQRAHEILVQLVAHITAEFIERL